MNFFRLIAFAWLCCAALAAQQQRHSIYVEEVEVPQTLVDSAERRGVLHALEAFVPQLHQRMVEALVRQRKFNVFDAPANKADSERRAGAKYKVVLSIDDFAAFSDIVTFGFDDNTMEGPRSKRSVRAGVHAKIYETQTNKLIGTSLDIDEAADTFAHDNSQTNAQDAILASKVAIALGKVIAHKAAESVYPAIVLAKSGKQVTIDRGRSSNISRGQIWIVYAQGEAVADPESGKPGRPQRVPVGKVKITSILGAHSIGQIIEDNGIEQNQLISAQE